MNTLYFGDNLDVLKRINQEHPDGFIDLIYIDPPFNSKRNYNILFEDADLEDTKAQKEAFADTWSTISYVETLQEIQDLNLGLYYVLHAFDQSSVSKSALSYLATMAIRIWYMRNVLKETGSFYLHCDPTMSHYLKIICDLIFGGNTFQNEIIWQRTPFSGSSKSRAKQLPRIHDVILFYSKNQNMIWNPPSAPYSERYLKRFKWRDERGAYRKTLLKTYSQETFDRLKQKNRLIEPMQSGAKYSYKQYLNESKGYTLIGDIWTDIDMINPVAKERLGYPTQKPEALLERIMKTSSNEGDVVADFFCGCGTTIAVAQKLNRQWFGVDISHLAIRLVIKRLQDTYDTKYETIRHTFDIQGVPKDIASAKELAEHTQKGRLKFQDWVIEFLLGGVSNPKKTADGGWDGHMTFAMGKQKEIILIEVKSGNVNVKNLREFIHVVNAQQAAIGVFICFQEYVTQPMEREAKQQGYYSPDISTIGQYTTQFPKIQILTIEQILHGEQVKMPMTTQGVFKTAGKHIHTSTQERLL
jgi:site-specific DNA-methyltransferase (adenine-specific)